MSQQPISILSKKVHYEFFHVVLWLNGDLHTSENISLVVYGIFGGYDSEILF